MRQRIGGLVALGMLVVASPAWAATYTIDPEHSTVSFKIRHLVSRVQGTFNEFSGTFTYVPQHPEQWNAEAVIQTASIDTRVEKRDAHLRTADFLDAAQFPTMTFRTTHITDVTATGAKVHGLLTLHGVEKPVTLDVAVLGEGPDPKGNARAGFTATATINRKDFGIVWNKALDSGQLLVGDEVSITLEVEGIQKQ